MFNFLHNLETEFIFVFQKFALNLCSVLVLLWRLFRNEMNLNFKNLWNFKKYLFSGKEGCSLSEDDVKIK